MENQITKTKEAWQNVNDFAYKVFEKESDIITFLWGAKMGYILANGINPETLMPETFQDALEYSNDFINNKTQSHF